MNQTTDLHRVVLCAANGKCSGNCRQGRDCGARPSPATVAMWAVIAVSSLVIVVGVASALGVFMPHIHL